MKRKITLLFMAVFLVLSLASFPIGFNAGGFGTVVTQAAENEEYDTETLKNYLTQLADALTGYSDEQILELQAQLQAQVDADRDNKQAKVLLDFVNDWMEIKAEMGEVTGYGEFSYEKTGKSLTTVLPLKTSGRDAKIIAVYRTYDMSSPTAVNAELVYTFSEMVGQAALNVVIGICTVFIILVIIALAIYAFNIIPYIQKKMEYKKSEKIDIDDEDDKVTIVSGQQKNQKAVVPAEDDSELIAVIAAAIAASEGVTTDDFVVKSIRRR